jgi:hypothetical protein
MTENDENITTLTTALVFQADPEKGFPAKIPPPREHDILSFSQHTP